MNETTDQEYSDLQVDYSRLPQVKPGHGPEALPEKGVRAPPVPAEVQAEVQQQREICGVRKRTFWVIVAVGIVIVAAAAIGGAVGGTRASRSASSMPTGLLATSKLASLNYTDERGVAYFRVYFQVSSNAIYQSAWNSTAQVWAVLPVTTAGYVSGAATDADVKAQTPIAAGVNWFATKLEFHLYFLDSQNRLQELWNNGNPDGPWIKGSLSGKFVASDESQLAYYGRQCEQCNANQVIVYQDDNRNLKFCYPPDPGEWAAVPIGSDIATSVQGSGFAMALDYSRTGEVSLFISTTNLQELSTDGLSWSKSYEFTQTFLPQFASIAAFSMPDSTGNGTFQVLTTAISGGGILVESWDSNVLWSSSAPSVFSEVRNSSVAANQAGRVYATMEDKSGRPFIAEWAFNSTASSFNLIGNVTTDVL